MVGLTGEVGGDVVVGSVNDEGAVAQVAPKHSEHAEPVSLLEGCGNVDDLVVRLLRAEVDRRADAGGADVKGALNRREHDLVISVRIGQELVVVELDDEGNPVRVLARYGAEHSDR